MPGQSTPSADSGWVRSHQRRLTDSALGGLPAAGLGCLASADRGCLWVCLSWCCGPCGYGILRPTPLSIGGVDRPCARGRGVHVLFRTGMRPSSMSCYVETKKLVSPLPQAWMRYTPGTPNRGQRRETEHP